MIGHPNFLLIIKQYRSRHTHVYKNMGNLIRLMFHLKGMERWEQISNIKFIRLV